MPAADPRAYHAQWRPKHRAKLRAKRNAYYKRICAAKRQERQDEIAWMNRK